MIVNKGFSFSNPIGEYKINYSDICAGDDLTYYEQDEKYQFLTIYEKYLGNQLSTLYSPESYDETNIAYLFATINVHNNSEIIDFCNTYGLPFSNRLYNGLNNTDYIAFHASKKDFLLASAKANEEPDYMYLCSFCSEVLLMRSVLHLLSGISEQNHVSLVNTICYLSLHPFGHFFSWIDHEEAFDYDDFRVHFYYFTRYHKHEEKPLHEQINLYLQALNNYYHLSDSEYYDCDLEFEFIFSSIGQNYASLLEKITEHYTILNITEDGTITWDRPITNEFIAEHLDGKKIIDFANTIALSIINHNISDITPALRYENNQLVGDWEISSLLSAMYLEIFMSINPEISIRKCENPTCNGYFDASTTNRRKKYCSQRCALLMAKRAQRERKRNDKQK